MAVLKGTRLYFVIVGVVEVALSLMFIICTKIVLHKYSEDGNTAEWYSLFYLYYTMTGILCILAGLITTTTIYVKASIGAHIVSVVISTIGAAVSSVFWQMYKQPSACETNTTGQCVCFKKTYALSCADGDLSRVLLAVLTSANIIMIMTSFIGSILACTNVCCDADQSGDQRNTRIDTSHSEQTVVSSIHAGHNSHELPTVCLSSVQTNIELRNYHPVLKNEMNSIHEENRV